MQKCRHLCVLYKIDAVRLRKLMMLTCRTECATNKVDRKLEQPNKNDDVIVVGILLGQLAPYTS